MILEIENRWQLDDWTQVCSITTVTYAGAFNYTRPRQHTCMHDENTKINY